MNAADAERATAPRPGMASALADGAAWGWLGAAAVGAAEAALLAVRSAGYGWGGTLPPALVAASFGEMIASQALLLVPAALVVAALARRHAAPAAAGVAVGAGGASTVVAHAALASHAGRLEAIALALLVAAGAVAAVRAARRRPRPRAALAASLALGLGAGVAFARSPLFDPGAVDPPPPDRPTATGTTPARPHVIWVVLDTVRADRTGLHDPARETTPFLRRWAEGAHVFDRAVADGTWTSPSHASMFTGLPVRAHGMGRDTVTLSTRFTTVAETLAGAGWKTASFSNNPLIGGGSGLARGFETRRIPSRLAALGTPAAEIWIHRFGLRPPLPWWERDQGAAVTNHLVARWLDAHAGGDAPLFLFVNYMEAHLPWEIPERYREAFLDEAGAARARALRHRAHGDLERALNQRVAQEGPDFLAPGDREVLRGLYDGTIRYLDARVAGLFGRLAEHGVLDDALVVVTSDHGEYLGQHDLWSHLYRTYQDLTHVVLAIRPPAGAAAAGGGRSDALVQLSDLHPTVLLHTLGPEAAPERIDRDRDLLRASDAPRIAISEAGPIGARTGGAGDAFRMPDTPRGRRLARPEIAVQDGRFKLVRPETGAAELYDLARDPGEEENVLGRHGPEALRLEGELGRWKRRVPEFRPSAEDLAPDGDLQRALRELGYVE